MITEQQYNEFLEFAKECRENHIPVVREQTAKILCGLIEEHKPQNILELGTAVGYSGTLMLLSSQNSKLLTVELNEDMCKKAYNTFERYNVLNRVAIVNDDILHFLENQNQKLFKDTDKNTNCQYNVSQKKFDFIFLDGPKGQYIKYYPLIKNLINKNGIVFCDDVLYFGMVQDDSKVIHKKITIVRNLREFLSIAQNDTDFDAKLLDIEDGVLILKRK